MLKQIYSALANEIGAWRQLYFFRRPVLMALAFYCLGILIAKQAGLWDQASKNDPSQWAGQRATLIGVVSSHPDTRPTGCVYRIQVETIETFDPRERHSVQGQLLVQVIKSTSALAAPGDRIRASGRLQKPKSSLIPGVFDYQDYLANQGIGTLMYTSSRSFENLGSSGEYDLSRWGWKIKQKAVKIFDSNLNSDQSTVLSGLSVGNRPRFNPEIRRIFIESGTMHVLVASGSNVAFVIAIWFLLSRLVRIPRRWALASALPSVWLYVLVAGADAPIARAGLMGTVGILSHLFNREDRPYQALGLTAFLLLMVNPLALFDIGFQMSFGTVFGLIYFLSPLENIIQKAPPWTRWPLRLLAATCTAQLWIAPVTAATFQRFFPVSVLSNLLVVPLAAVGLHAGFMVGAVEIFHWVKPPFIFLTKLYLSGLIGLTRFFADQMGQSVWVAPFPLMSVVGFYVLLLTSLHLRHSILSRLLFFLGLLFLGTGFLLRPSRRLPVHSMSVTWVDTGKRLTTLIETSDGKKILINPGPTEPVDTTERILMPFLTRAGIHSLDAVIITDPDLSRTASVASLVKWVQVSTVVVCNAPALWISDGERTLLILSKPTLKVQDALLSTKLSGTTVIQTHFPRNWKWRQNFLERFEPELLIETNMVSAFHPSVPPWEAVDLVIPQKCGWYRWEGD